MGFLFLRVGRSLLFVLGTIANRLFFRGTSDVSFRCKLRGENLPCLQCFRRMPCSWDLTAPPSNLSFPYLLLLPQEGIVCGLENPEVDGNRLRFFLLNQNALVECGNPMC